MADNTLVNSQITDAVTQTNVKVVAEAPAQAIASLYQVSSHSTGLALQNAVQPAGAEPGLQRRGVQGGGPDHGDRREVMQCRGPRRGG
ncbi:RebB family R body protein [Xanthomonas sacchari]|uniref:RebB family R body protein n=1 Tax=Xanthomonas sacchari TaxID=56458 RepID=UPI00225E2355|nr:RebB family R body protein [Xanthomonas sacchari]UYK81918.1 RebB family R body protein [Xanthomonas sacchari]